MAHKHKQEHFDKIYDAVEEYPGERPDWIARLLGLHRSQVPRSLPAMEERGDYLSEDEKGGLWSFRRGS